MSGGFKEALLAAMPAVRGFARTFERNGPRADDLVQETMVKAWANREKFRPGTNMKAWLFTILRNTYISQARKKRREVEDADGALTGALSEAGRQQGHMALLDLRAALAELPDDQREALLLVGASGFSYDEAGEIVGVAAGTIKSRVSRARARLAELMGESGDAGLDPPDTAPLRPALC
ncbi:MAG: sigma-70 family RNA polymerase sigma factor [Pikeienuella sp.]|uniref:sigma-70 family RNA polymerase sigma factor n=1 Tax=Pikeienuella sp. TaxID=2831957 RepID=UPI0039187551